jgi:hypothetical protein
MQHSKASRIDPIIVFICLLTELRENLQFEAEKQTISEFAI